jgi:hypothetical protein
LGGFRGFDPPGSDSIEVARVAMKAVAPSDGTFFVPTLDNVLHPADDTLVYAAIDLEPPESSEVAADEIELQESLLVIHG